MILIAPHHASGGVLSVVNGLLDCAIVTQLTDNKFSGTPQHATDRQKSRYDLSPADHGEASNAKESLYILGVKSSTS
jgi:hypothetical protein